MYIHGVPLTPDIVSLLLLDGPSTRISSLQTNSHFGVYFKQPLQNIGSPASDPCRDYTIASDDCTPRNLCTDPSEAVCTACLPDFITKLLEFLAFFGLQMFRCLQTRPNTLFDPCIPPRGGDMSIVLQVVMTCGTSAWQACMTFCATNASKPGYAQASTAASIFSGQQSVLQYNHEIVSLHGSERNGALPNVNSKC